MRSRRAVLAAGMTGTVALSAGCLGFVLGDEPLEFAAARAEPTDDALSDAGYEHVETRREDHDETVEAAGATRSVRATYWHSTYEKTLERRVLLEEGALDDVDEESETELADDHDGVDQDSEREIDDSDEGTKTEQADFDDPDEPLEAAFLAIVSMPAMEVLGTTYNPLADMDSEQLLAEMGAESDDDHDHELEDATRVETIERSILGDDRDVDVFETTTTVDDREIDLDVLVAAFGHEDDYLVFVGGYPSDLEDEREALETVLTSIDHPIE